MKNRILIVEDDPEVARLIQMTLRSADYKYGIARNGNKTLQFIPIFQPDVLLLDLMLPDMDGMDIIKQIRAANNNIPIIVISARDEDADKVQALDLGADDYLTKPFSIDELLARIRVSLRRTNIIYNNGKTNINNYCNGELTINFDSQTVKVNQNEIHLTPIEYKVLMILAENTSRVLTHRYLLKEVWGTESVEDTSSLRVTIATLRKKIEVNTQNQYIKTHIGVGYQMVQVDS